MITRRCTQRTFLLRPDPTTTQIFLYCLALAANLYGVRVFFTIANSNHHHTGIHDPEGRYPAFLQYFHRLVACCQNARLGRWENLWASEQTSVVRLTDEGAVLEKTIYALTNPVKDHLVARASDWPGASSLQQNLTGKTIKVRRPARFFTSVLFPDEIELKIERPPGFEHMTQEAFAALLREQIATVERSAAAERAAKGTSLLGRQTVLRQGFHESPRSFEPRRGMSPRVAGQSKWARIETLERLKQWLVAYRIAWLKFASGLHDVVFPAGTYAMRLNSGAHCAALPDSG